jgi:hypothetical protein
MLCSRKDHYHRPELEMLEAREVPAAGINARIGIFPPTPTAALIRFDNTIKADLNAIHSDFATLQADVATATSFNATIIAAYNRVGADFTAISKLDAKVDGGVALATSVSFFALTSGRLSSVELMLLLQIDANASSASATADSALAQANVVIHTPPGNGFPTVAAQLHL